MKRSSTREQVAAAAAGGGGEVAGVAVEQRAARAGGELAGEKLATELRAHVAQASQGGPAGAGAGAGFEDGLALGNGAGEAWRTHFDAVGEHLYPALAGFARELLAEGVEPQRLLLLAPERAACRALESQLAASADAGGERAVCPQVRTVAELCAELLRAQAMLDGEGEAPLLISDPARAALSSGAFQPAGDGHAADRQRARARRLASDLAGIDALKAAGLRSAQLPTEVLDSPDRLSKPARRLGRSLLAYERALRSRGLIDSGDLANDAAAALAGSRALASRVGASYDAILLLLPQSPEPALCMLLSQLCGAIGRRFAAACPPARAALSALMAQAPQGGSAADRAGGRLPAGGGPPAEQPDGMPPVVLPGTLPGAGSAPAQGSVGEAHTSFWRFPDERALASFLAATIARLLSTGADLPPAAPSGESAPAARAAARRLRVDIACRSLEHEGPMIAAALREVGVPFAVLGAPAAMRSATARDLIAWLSFLADGSAGAMLMRLLSRPPWALGAMELARVGQLARKAGLDFVAALRQAQESAALEPDARSRIGELLRLREELIATAGERGIGSLVPELLERGALSTLAAADEQSRIGSEVRGIESLALELQSLSPERPAVELMALLAQAAADGFAVAPRHAEVAGCGISEPVLIRSLEAGQIASAHLFVSGLCDAAALGLGAEPGWELVCGARCDHAAVAQLSAEFTDRSAAAGRWAEFWPPAGEAALAHLLAGARDGATILAAEATAGGERACVWPLVERLRLGSEGEWRGEAELSRALQEALGEQALIRGAIVRAEEHLGEEVDRIAARLGELRLDSDRDLAGGVAALLDLLKLKGLAVRSGKEQPAESLADLNARIRAACTPAQQELFDGSPLDEQLLEALSAVRRRLEGPRIGRALGGGGGVEELSLAALVPRHGEGVALSASDITLYRLCPLRYRYARLLRIPVAPTPQQRFGIALHQALERFHAQFLSGAGEEGAEQSRAQLLRLLDGAWRRGGFRDDAVDRQWHERAREALTTYHQRLSERAGRTAWVERPFSLRLGEHRVRGRVDRVDLLPDGSYGLIDYKSGRARSPEQLAGDVQLSLYSLAASRCWNVEAAQVHYHYLLDDRRVAVPDEDRAQREARVEAQIQATAEAILRLQFEPTPSFAACASCEYLALCPASESGR